MPTTTAAPDPQLADAFRQALLDWCSEIHNSEDKYYPTRFGPQVRARNGLGVVAYARDRIEKSPAEGTTGFRRMLEIGRGEQTLEHVVLRARWRPLFPGATLDVARFRLKQAGVPAPAEPEPRGGGSPEASGAMLRALLGRVSAGECSVEAAAALIESWPVAGDEEPAREP